MADKIIDRQILVTAPKEVLWDHITTAEHIRSWVSAFSEGTRAESDWAINSEVIWRDGDGKIGARGLITDMVPDKMLVVEYWNDPDAPADAPRGPYTERFVINSGNGECLLSVTAGPLDEKNAEPHGIMWTKALHKLKAQCEQAVAQNKMTSAGQGMS